MIYIVEDDENIREMESYALKNSGFEVIGFGEGKSFFAAIEKRIPLLVVLDIMLPGDDGLEILKKIKAGEKTKNLPVIMVTAKTAEIDAVKGLDGGADDYITKPFGIKELLARINSVLRRYNKTANKVEDILSVKDIKMDLIKHEVTKKDKKIDLTIKEFDLLKLLLQNKGKVLSRNFLLDKVWGYEYFGETRTVDVHIR